jgi:hypothetical protein
LPGEKSRQPALDVERSRAASSDRARDQPGSIEVTDRFLAGAAILLVLAGVLSALWSPRLP